MGLKPEACDLEWNFFTVDIKPHLFIISSGFIKMMIKVQHYLFRLWLHILPKMYYLLMLLCIYHILYLRITYLPFCLSVWLSFYLRVCLSICLYAWQSVCVFVCTSVCLSFYQWIHPSIYLTFYLATLLLVFLQGRFMFMYTYVYASFIYVPTHLSDRLPVCWLIPMHMCAGDSGLL